MSFEIDIEGITEQQKNTIYEIINDNFISKAKVSEVFKNRVEQITLHCKDEILVHNQVVLLQSLSNELNLDD